MISWAAAWSTNTSRPYPAKACLAGRPAETLSAPPHVILRPRRGRRIYPRLAICRQRDDTFPTRRDSSGLIYLTQLACLSVIPNEVRGLERGEWNLPPPQIPPVAFAQGRKDIKQAAENDITRAAKGLSGAMAFALAPPCLRVQDAISHIATQGHGPALNRVAERHPHALTLRPPLRPANRHPALQGCTSACTSGGGPGWP